MQIILLSGGSGTRLWPLSNDARSKQFLKLLPKEGSDEKESMVQRVVRQINESGIKADITVAISLSQKDSITSQLGNRVDIVAEPSRRGTFPAICLACEYLAKEKHISPEETIIVMPCDPFTEEGYFQKIKSMAKAVSDSSFELIVMGVTPTYPSSKYGYVMASNENFSSNKEVLEVEKFIEKPSEKEAEKLISEGALWNAGVFGFKLGFLTKVSDNYFSSPIFHEYLKNYDKFPWISFDCEVAEKCRHMGMVEYRGFWKDLGTWNTLTDEIPSHVYGNVLTDGLSKNTHVFNELNMPMLVLGTENLVIAASHDGIIVTEKSKSETIKDYARRLKSRPMYEERRWGTYKVIDSVKFDDNFQALTKQLTLNPGASLSYQRHSCRDEVWTFIDGEGELVVNGKRRHVGRGDVIVIPKGDLHTLRAITPLTFIEVQHGENLIEEDIERFPYDWDKSDNNVEDKKEIQN
ncbi:MAG: cupin domain-containing protein [Muribaculaceae bacterium]|nr:cupin domain-containing protein [Muribaculaceae bacterium]